MCLCGIKVFVSLKIIIIIILSDPKLLNNSGYESKLSPDLGDSSV